MSDTVKGITETDVTNWSSVPAGDPNLTAVVTATNGYVSGLPAVANLDDGTAWPGQVVLGALMLASRLLRRVNSPNGIEALTSDSVSYVARYDSDIARLLGLDGFQKPAVG